MELGCCLQLLWLRVLMSRWFNVKIVDDFSSDELSADEEEEEEEEEEDNDEDEEEEEEPIHARTDLESVSPFPSETITIQPAETTWSSQQGIFEGEFLLTEQIRIAVGTWNVAGRTPPPHLDLKDWLDWDRLADIYVVGFQEIVPLNVSNVCGIDDVKPANKWQDLIRNTLNKLEVEVDGTSINEETLSCNDEAMEDETLLVRPLLPSLSSVPFTSSNPGEKQDRYVRVASKQMVGIHISVWVRRKLCRFIHNLSVSCVGLGLMGCLGNKGSVSVSMRLHQTTLCFICSHLTSGDKDGDEERRNWDAMEILKRTHFPLNKDATADNLRNILEHHRIVWLGDLNYRLNLRDDEIRLQVAQENWTSLFKNDQLKEQCKEGHIFEGWYEGAITFAPTYKYKFNSNDYAGGNVKHGKKQRSPAWCDRVLWHGKGLKLLAYKCGESAFSDHRPVLAVFAVEVEVRNTKSQQSLIGQACKTEG